MISFLSHIFLPQESNNYRSKLLHHNILLFFIAFIISSTFLIDVLKVNLPSVLGIQTNITAEQLLVLTNQKRAENSLPPLMLNNQLSNAAGLKAQDMFDNNYWAHNSPDGKTPWIFIKQAGYNYSYAGENLAKGFNSAEDVVNAWMESPKHRENMLFKNYSDVGFSVVSGKLNGQDTVLIVQELGDQAGGSIASNETEQTNATPKVEPSPALFAQSEPSPAASNAAPIISEVIPATRSSAGNVVPRVFAGAATDGKPILNSLSFSLNMDKALLTIFIVVLILDMLVVERKRIVRLVGHNTDHILFLFLVMLFVAVFSKGVIL